MNDYFIWNGNPELFEIGAFSLPIEISIPGLILAVIGYFAATMFLQKKGTEKAGRRKKNTIKNVELSFLQLLGIALGAFSLGQLLFIASDTMTISEIGPIAPRWYGLMFALSFLLGYFIGSKTFEHAGKPPHYAEEMFMYLLIATIFGARFGHVFFYDFDYYILNLHEIFYFWQGGLASHGAVIGVLLALWLFSKRHPDARFFWLTDRIALPFALGGMFVRIGNFFNSEILGSPTDVSWAVIFAKEDMIPRHPAMLYEAVLCLGLFLLLVYVYKYYKNSPPEGSLTAIFMVVLFIGRFVIEYAKERQPGFDETLTFLSMGQILSIPFILIGIWLAISRVDWKKQIS
jgi:phosphatidylglycerol---prolipoprotein diacylglyceryl transferase